MDGYLEWDDIYPGPAPLADPSEFDEPKFIDDNPAGWPADPDDDVLYPSGD